MKNGTAGLVNFPHKSHDWVSISWEVNWKRCDGVVRVLTIGDEGPRFKACVRILIVSRSHDIGKVQAWPDSTTWEFAIQRVQILRYRL